MTQPGIELPVSQAIGKHSTLKENGPVQYIIIIININYVVCCINKEHSVSLIEHV